MCSCITKGILLAVTIIASISFHIAPTEGQRRIVCYYTNWPQYRPGAGRYTVTNVDPMACTHLVFAFGKVLGNKIEAYETNDRKPYGGAYRQLTNLKMRNPNLITLLGVGGWTHGPRNFTKMVATQQNRQEFILDSISLLREFNFDGLDLDWEYPGMEEPSDKQQLSELLKELRTEYDREAQRTNQKRLLITMAVAAGIKNAEKAYDIPVIDRYLDMYNLMAYDLHGSWEKFTGLATPLKSNTDDLSAANALLWYNSHGATTSKINLGLSFYARTWTLQTPGDLRLGAPAPREGKPGAFTREGGALSYYEVCDMINRGMKTIGSPDPVGQTMYGVLDDQFVTYENEETLTIKLNYIIRMGLGGAMVWSLDHDDFTGQFCGQGKTPLLNVVREKMTAAPALPGVDPVYPPVVTPRPYPPVVTPRPYPPVVTPRTYPPVVTPRTYPPPIVTRPPTQPPPVNPGNTPVCPPEGGRIADPSSIYSYFVCLRGFQMKYYCRSGSTFNPYSKECEN